ncbi:MAG: YihY/virulence factor BrkB family protein [Ferrimicrobium sp.]|jgi:YihY family inner membrane protein|uniref:YihY/virulence factor BrkB family protein n=1 Tax=Ferrimicrobium acidiphilum TaxID=121039 RepID=A0ABV3Y514_9ACTN|nr:MULTISPECIES: YhjD/YihY/BrkB family envelope integrity protein [Ferrimicrobium]
MPDPQKLLRRLDELQQRHRPLAFGYAVIRKYGQDSASTWALLIAYYGFASLFPLLLVAMTLTGLIFAHDPSLSHQISNTVFAQIPIIGAQLRSQAGVHALATHSLPGLIIGILGLIWGSQGVASAAQQAMATVWNVPMTDRPGYLSRTLRNFGVLGVLGVNVVVTSSIATFTATLGGHDVGKILLIITTISLNLALYVVGFRFLAPKSIPTRDILPGALVAGIAWSALQQVGGYLVGHELAHASATYGVFGLVLGLITWLALTATATLYAAEINVVHVRKLWPRSLLQPPLTTADRVALIALTKQQRYRPEQLIYVTFSTAATPEDPVEDAKRDRCDR